MEKYCKNWKERKHHDQLPFESTFQVDDMIDGVKHVCHGFLVVPIGRGGNLVLLFVSSFGQALRERGRFGEHLLKLERLNSLDADLVRRVSQRARREYKQFISGVQYLIRFRVGVVLWRRRSRRLMQMGLLMMMQELMMMAAGGGLAQHPTGPGFRFVLLLHRTRLNAFVAQLQPFLIPRQWRIVEIGVFISWKKRNDRMLEKGLTMRNSAKVRKRILECKTDAKSTHKWWLKREILSRKQTYRYNTVRERNIEPC